VHDDEEKVGDDEKGKTGGGRGVGKGSTEAEVS